VALVFLAGSCGGTEAGRESAASTTSPSKVGAPPAEQVCQLLSDDEVSTALAIDAAVHTPAESGPRSCTWAPAGDPTKAVVRLRLGSQQWLESPPSTNGIGAPCEQGITLGETVLGDGDALFASCLVDGLTVFLAAQSIDRPHQMGLLNLAVSRLGSIDRVAFGFASTTMSRKPSAPPECVEAWRSEEFAPLHCEDYSEAFRAFREESEAG